MHRPAPFAACLFAAGFALAGCRGGQPAADPQAREADLPAPAAGGGAVTGMPDMPGPGAIGAPAAMPTTLADANATDASVAAAAGDGVDVAPAPVAGDGAEPGPDAAAQLLRDYYAAIGARDFARAYRLWGDGGRASGQTARQFADGFADTREVGVVLGAPGNEDAGAGQRYIEIPATVTAVRTDGSRRRYAGSYVLHRTVVDGASAEQRAWRIERADLREVAP